MRRLLLCTALVLAGCSTRVELPQPFTPADVYIDAPPEQVWSALLQVYADMNLPLGAIDKPSWFLRSGTMTRPPHPQNRILVDCGRISRYGSELGPRAQEMTIYTTLTTLLFPTEGGTYLRNRLHANGLGYGERLVCQTTGDLEDRIVSAIRDRLPARGMATAEGY